MGVVNLNAIFHSQTLGMFAREVVAAAELRGFTAHRLGIGQERSASLLVLTKRPRVVWALLRPERSDPTEGQRKLLAELAACGQEVVVWKPSTMRQMRAVLERDV
jgi:hypothetical protein